MNNFDVQYKALVKDILANGVNRGDRTGVGSRAVFGKSFTVDLSDGFPILTSRKVSFRIAFEETMFFLRGDTDTKKLESKGINIWKGNTSREFLNKRGLGNLPEGDMGKGYGYQWTRWEKITLTDRMTFKPIDTAYNEYDEHETSVKGNPVKFIDHPMFARVEYINQVKDMLHRAKQDPNDRRLLIEAWNPGNLDDMSLPPCHHDQQYQVLDGKLNSLFKMRSVDVMYGLPFNVMSYAFLNMLFSKYLNLQPGTLTFFGGDTHLYLNQLGIADELLDASRFEYNLPKLMLKKNIKTYGDMLGMQWSKEDLELLNYQAHPDFENKPPMAV